VGKRNTGSPRKRRKGPVLGKGLKNTNLINPIDRRSTTARTRLYQCLQVRAHTILPWVGMYIQLLYRHSR
jgi:hypothetical protein